uniref:polysaccharide biosynthesis protein n=1 Tax=Acetatifactor sp. TaxID=1872090 RepID=UPI0040575DDA
MKINRTKNATVNLFFSILLRVYRIIVPFIMRSVFIYTIGIEFLGLNSLFTSVLQVLNLAELGVGSAMVYSMYKPIVEDDETTICALMRLYKIYYRFIGLVVLAIGVCLVPVLPKLIKGEVPDGISIYVLYFMHLGCTVLSYWLFAYKNSLLTAYQRSDVTSKVSLAVDTLKYVLQLLALFVLKNYYVYVLIILFMQIVENISVAVCVNKMYPKYQPKGKLEKEKVSQINQRIKDLFTAKLGMVVINSADTIVISAFLGLSVLAVYQNYFYIITSITGLMSTIYASCRAGIGNSLIVESEEKNYKDLSAFTLMIGWVSTVAVTCLLCLMQPFMTMWMGTEHLLSVGCVICFCLYFFVFEVNQLLSTYKDAAGIWRKDRFRPMITALTNLFVNLLLVNYIGVYGVLLSTVLSTLFVGMPWLLHNLFTELFHHNLKEYVLSLIKHLSIAVVSCVISYVICMMIPDNGFITLVIKALICMIISNGILFCAWRRKEEFAKLMGIIRRLLKKA